MRDGDTRGHPHRESRSISGSAWFCYTLAVLVLTGGGLHALYRSMEGDFNVEKLSVFLAGTACALLFWAIGMVISGAHKNRVVLTTILKRIEDLPSAGQRAEMPPQVGVDQQAAGADSVSENDTLLHQIMDTLAEINTAVLLTEEEKGLRRQEVRAMIVSDLTAQIEAAIETGDFMRAESLCRRFSAAVPGDDQVSVYHEKIQELRTKEAQQQFEEYGRQVNDLMSVSNFVEAQILAQEVCDRFPGFEAAEKLLERVRCEYGSFTTEQTQRLSHQIRLYAEKRQWKNALEAARELIEKFPDSQEAAEVKARMSTLVDNTRIEEVRELRDRILDMVDRRRYAEALELSTQVVDNYPETAAAAELRAQMPKLRELAEQSPH